MSLFNRVNQLAFDFALCGNYLKIKDHIRLHDNYNHICRMLAKMMANYKNWCGQTLSKTLERKA